MNIFVLDREPRLAARAHYDRHVVKMIVETCQILCGAAYLNGREAELLPMKPTHLKHPCVLWARTEENAVWLYALGLELCAEYSFRYAKRHKTQDSLAFFAGDFAGKSIAGAQFIFCGPEESQIDADVVACYRHYYQHAKAHLAAYKGRRPPSWLGIPCKYQEQKTLEGSKEK